MFKRKPYIPERPKEVIYTPANWIGIKAEYDRLYLEKCQEVNELEQKVEKYKSMAEIAVKQKGELEDRVGRLGMVIDGLKTECIEYRNTIRQMEDELEEAKKTIRELAAEQLPFGFIPDVEPPEELPEELAESVPLWASQAVSSQDILCLSSALKNLYEIHKTDGWLLYNRLAKVLEQKIEEYCKEEG